MDSWRVNGVNGVRSGARGLPDVSQRSAGGRQTSLRGSDPRAQTATKQNPLWSEESEEEGEEMEGGRWREGGSGEGEGGGGSRFIARSREASTEHSFNQTVTSPPGAARRLENRSLLGSLPRLRFCSHAPRLSSERCAGSDGTIFFLFNPSASGGAGEKKKKKTSAITTTFYRRPDIKQNTGISSLLSVRDVPIDLLCVKVAP